MRKLSDYLRIADREEVINGEVVTVVVSVGDTVEIPEVAFNNEEVMEAITQGTVMAITEDGSTTTGIMEVEVTVVATASSSRINHNHSSSSPHNNENYYYYEPSLQAACVIDKMITMIGIIIMINGKTKKEILTNDTRETYYYT
jgi:hypothetical protein